MSPSIRQCWSSVGGWVFRMGNPGMRQERMDKIVNIYFKGRNAGLSVFGMEESDRFEL